MRKRILESSVLLLIAVLAISTASAQVTVSIGDLTAYQNESITAPIMINNVTNYGTGTIKVTYDPSVVHVTDVASTADSPFVVWNIDNETGYVLISAMNPMGVSGDIAFANVTFKAVGSPEDVSYLNIEIETLMDTSFNDIPAIPLNGSFRILVSSPTVSITTDKVIYHPRDTMIVTINLTNPLNTTQELLFVWFFGIPDKGYWKKIVDTSLTLSPDSSYIIQREIPIGDWGRSFNAVFLVFILDPETHEIIDDDNAMWSYMATRASVWRDNRENISANIGEEIEREVEGHYF